VSALLSMAARPPPPKRNTMRVVDCYACVPALSADSILRLCGVRGLECARPWIMSPTLIQGHYDSRTTPAAVIFTVPRFHKNANVNVTISFARGEVSALSCTCPKGFV